jgi:hypothetical protein
MNPARTFGPDLVGTEFTSYWVYVAGPLLGAVLAVGVAWVLRGPGGGAAGSGAAQGDLFTEVEHPEKTVTEWVLPTRQARSASAPPGDLGAERRLPRARGRYRPSPAMANSLDVGDHLLERLG